MLKEKDLAGLVYWTYDKGQRINCDMIENVLQGTIDDRGYNITLIRDTVSSGGLLGGREYDCLRICNPDHVSDYYNYVLTINRDGRDDSLIVSLCGNSSQVRKDDMLGKKVFDGTISRSIGAGMKKGGSVGAGFAIGGAAAGLAKAGIKGIGKGLSALTRDKEAYETEMRWYSEAQELIMSTFAPEA